MNARAVHGIDAFNVNPFTRFVRSRSGYKRQLQIRGGAMTEPGIALSVLSFMAVLFIVVVGTAAAVLVILFIIDRLQTENAIRRNYPVIGRLRAVFEHLGVFFRQYFFAMDREELPFNRSERQWVYRAARGVDNTSAFGSTRDLRPVGSVYFVNCPFPTLSEDVVAPGPRVIGEGCEKPYLAPSLFNVSGMSFGSISVPAVRALSRGAAQACCWLNTGEGGLSPFHLEGGCDLVFQIGTAKYGVRDESGRLSTARLKDLAALEQVRMFEIKLSQGAKPGKGGILPASKVTPEIAAIRGIPAGKDSISPNGHPDVRSVSELLDLIGTIREVTGKPVGIKFVLGAYGWLESLFDEIRMRGAASAPDFITLDSADGGTGAAPGPLMDYVGLPLRESLPMVVDMRDRHGLRERVRVIASGKLVNPSEVAWAVCMGADFVVSARGFMFALGCIQALQCNRNTCPTGITTHDPRLQKGLDPRLKSERVANYVRNMMREVGMIAHSCGVREPRELRRFHVRMVTSTGTSVALDQLYPQV
jgi:glutamate synthase domain-containing protein 2